MLTRHTFSLLLFAVIVFIGTASCSNKGSDKSHVQSTFTDSISIDSTTLYTGGRDYNAGYKGAIKIYVMDTLVPVYVQRGSRLYLDTTLSLADTVRTISAVEGEYMDNRFYPVTYSGKHGYIRGTSLGFGIESDFDNDGKKNLVLYGYSSYVRDTSQENSFNPIVIKFISAGAVTGEIHDTAYSVLTITEVKGVRLSKKIHCYELAAGYPACGYPQIHFIIAYGNGRAEIIHRSVSSVDGGYGDFCEFTYPVDSTHHTDTIYISHRLALPLSDSNDSIIYSTLDSTILYLHQGRWGEKTYRMDSTSN